MSSEGGLLAPWLLYLPRPDQTRPGPREQTETWPTATANHYRIYILFYLGSTGKGQPKERAVSGGLSFCHSFLNASAFRSVPVALLPLCPSISLLSLPCLSPFLFCFPLVSLSSSLSSVLFISLPQHPVPYLWCVLVLAKARPGRTGGYLVRQRSPWAPTPFPPPGAAQVSRWKVRGEKGGEGGPRLKAWAESVLLWHSGSGSKTTGPAFKAIKKGCSW